MGSCWQRWVQLGGAPDHALVVWLWDKGKVLGINKLMQPVECNVLRTDNKGLKLQNAQLHTELQRQSQSTVQAPMRRQLSAGALRPSTSGRLTAGSSLPIMRVDSGGGSRGQLLRGSASVSGRERTRMAEMLVAQVRAVLPS